MSGKVVHPPGSVKLAFTVDWLTSVTADAEGVLTIRFADGRTVDSIVLLNDQHQELHRSTVRAMPGEALVLRTRVLTDIDELLVPEPTEDHEGVYSAVHRSMRGNHWVMLRRVPGRIADVQVARAFGGGRFRIDTIYVSPNGAEARVATRQLNLDANTMRNLF